MINLPRQLIYQDRHVLEDYTAGNELNQALYDALRSIKHPSLLQRWKGVPALSDDDILRIFNDAYYLCMVMSNDERYILHNSRFREQVSSVYAWQVALVILSLQKHLTQNAKKHLYLYKCRNEITEPFLHVLDSFIKRGSAFWMNFHLQLPDVYTLEIDWEVATRGFNVDIIKGILRLWSDVRNRLSVCRKIYNELAISPRRDMPQYSMVFLYLARLMEFWRRAVMLGWNRYWMDEYFSSKPSVQEEPVVAEKSTSDEVDSSNSEDCTARALTYNKKSMFVDKYNNEDVSRTSEETKRFRDFIKAYGPKELVLDTKGGSFLNLALVAFYEQWEKRGWISGLPNYRACYRFMCSCGIKAEKDEKTYSGKIAKMLKGQPGERDEQELEKIRSLVEGVFAKV